MPITGGQAISPSAFWEVPQGTEELADDVAVTSGNSAWGAWTQISAATAADIYWLNVSMHEPTNYNLGVAGIAMQIGVGAAAAEVAVAGAGIADGNQTEEMMHGNSGAMPVFIPAGSRVCIRTRCELGALDHRWNVSGMTP